MDAFRISLIVAGVTVLLVVYLFDSNNKLRSYFKNLQLKQFFTKKKYFEKHESQEPEISEDSEILEHFEQMEGIVATQKSNAANTKGDLGDKEQETATLTAETPVSPSPDEEMVIVFFIVSRGKQIFNGADINKICVSNGFEFSEKNIYEKFSDTNFKDSRPIASIVNSFEPGTFDADFEKFNTKAITLLLFLPGPDTEMKAFEDIVLRGKNIAQNLNGELCDETRSVLTQQTISHLEEKIEEFQFKNKMLKTHQQH
ncbi:MAG: cell division protein ZipA C-terminal FtsZ-binding domain-containing protein [Thiohalomonadales bacterium]